MLRALGDSDEAKAVMRLVLVDMAVTQGSPAGSCVRTMVSGLVWGKRLTVVASDCDLDPVEHGFVWLRARAWTRPLLMRYLTFHAQAAWVARRVRSGSGTPVLVQATQGQLVGADVVYAHFCHGAYLPRLWALRQWRSLRFWSRYLTHGFNAWRERLAFEQARCVVVPSVGLKRELLAHYHLPEKKVEVLANPVDIARFTPDPAFDRVGARMDLGWGPDTVVLSFMALGDFERKGLGILLEAMAGLPDDERVKLALVVIGGQPDEIASFKVLAATYGMAERVQFLGMQKDVRPGLWLSDAFVFPSLYEIFSLAVLQAAAAGLPVVVPKALYGAEEFIGHGRSGWLIERSPGALREVLMEMLNAPERLRVHGALAREAAQHYGQEVFCQRWIELYARMGMNVDAR